MPETNLTPAQVEAYAVARINDPTLETIEISHSVGGRHLLVRNREPITATLETGETVEFEPVAFRYTRPTQGENGAIEFSVQIDNVDRRISAFIDAVTGSQEETKIKYRTFLASDLSQPSMIEPIELTVTEITMSILDVTLKCRSVDVLNRPFPNENFTRQRFPSLGS